MGSLWTIAVVILVNIRLAMDIRRWVFITHAAVWGSIIITYACMDNLPSGEVTHLLAHHSACTDLPQGKKKERNAARYMTRSQAIKILQSSLLHSRPKSTVGTPAYIAPEVLARLEYDGKLSLFMKVCNALYMLEGISVDDVLVSEYTQTCQFHV
ncbi:hypothetical protein GOBAR_DD19408 [Gossypium barbadense]|nr:hypothetical protein GOBAR_DD19408 [Gossypium barbadense]